MECFLFICLVNQYFDMFKSLATTESRNSLCVTTMQNTESHKQSHWCGWSLEAGTSLPHTMPDTRVTTLESVTARQQNTTVFE